MEKVATKKKFFGVEYDPEIFQPTHYACDEPYERPKPFVIDDLINYIQPWSGYVPESSLSPEDEKRLPVSCYNIKSTARYRGAEAKGNKWMKLACSEALRSVQNGGGPFGSAIVQVDDETERVIRYWLSWNHVTEWIDPTAHGEITGIRQVCQELGVFNLGRIEKDDPNLKLPQKCKTSRIELYSNAEPCSMCYTGIRWARINWVYFAATIYDAAAQGVRFSDEPIFNELSNNYADRAELGANVFQCEVDNSLDSFNHYKRTGAIKY
jgi:guanine deaminase